MIFGVENITAVASVQWQTIGQRYLVGSRDCRRLVEQRLKECLAATLLPACRGVQRHLGGDSMVGAKSRIDARQPVQAVQHQPCRGDHHDGQRDLRNDQDHGQAKPRTFTGEPAATHAQSPEQIHRRHFDRGNQPKEKPARIDAHNVNTISPQCREISWMRGVSAGSRRTKRRRLARAAHKPTAPAAIPMTTLSDSNC